MIEPPPCAKRWRKRKRANSSKVLELYYAFCQHSAVLRSPCSTLKGGLQSSANLVFSISTCNDPNNCCACLLLPKSWAPSLRTGTGIGTKSNLFSKATPIFFSNSVVDKSSPSEAKNTWFAAFGWSMQRHIKSTKLSTEINNIFFFFNFLYDIKL